MRKTLRQDELRIRLGQTQGRSDLAGRLTQLPEPEHRLTDRHRNGTRHGQTSQKR
jgi:hypothetical protein